MRTLRKGSLGAHRADELDAHRQLFRVHMLAVVIDELGHQVHDTV